ncbi:MAG: hypothetical protein ACYSPI_12315, partial [Planctomycetota bacterium]
MTHTKMLLLGFVVFLSGVAGSAVDTGVQEIPEVTAAVQKLIDDEKLSGAVVAVVQKDKLIHFKAQGLRDMEHSEP